LVDASGDPISGTPVNFTSTVGVLTPATGNDLTDTSGVASVELGAGTIADAGTAGATATVDGVQISSNVLGIQSDGGATGAGSATVQVSFTLTTVNGSTTVSRSNPGTATVTVTDGAGAPVSNAVVTIGSNAGVLDSAGGSTNASGVFTTTLRAGTAAGSGSLTATVTSGSETVDATPIAFFTDGDAVSTVTLSIPAGGTTTTTSNAAPVTISATVVDDQGAPVQGAIVTFTKTNAGGSTDSGVLSNTIDITNASGVATTNLLAGTVAGPGSITASATVNGEAVNSAGDNTITFQSSGDGPFDGTGSSNLNIVLALLNGSGTTFTGSIDANNPGVLQATVTDANGNAVESAVVEFVTDGVGDVFPVGGSALTNAAGIATVALNAGSTPGAGQATATLIIDGGRFNSDSLTFNTLGNAGDATIVVTLTFTDATPGNGTNIITVNDPATVGILVEDENGNNLPNRTAAITTSLGTTSVGGGTAASTITAVTDSDGRVSANLTAGSEFGTGDYVVVVGDTQASVQFTVGVAGLQIGTCSGGTSATDCTSSGASRTGFAAPLGTASNGTLSVSTSPLSAGGTSQVSVVVLDATGSPVSDVDISLTSNCVEINDAGSGNPLSSITQTVRSGSNGVATATYQDDEGCARTDIITATEASTGETATGNIEVLAAQIGAIVFDQVTLPDGVTQTDSIFIRESGGTSSARVVFQVLDVLGQPAPDQTVSFSLTSTVGDIALQNTEGLTDADGKVAAIVSAGFIATTVRVRASLDADTDNDGDNTDFPSGAQTLATLSGQLSINTGIADQNSFTLAASELNFEGNNFDGETVTLTGFLADRFNNPVTGTAIQFRSEFGTIQPSCTTADSGSCTVTLTSTDPRGPLNTNVSQEQISAGNCPNTLIVEEAVTIDGSNNGDTEYTVSEVHRVETTADVLIASSTYTVDSDGSGITCTGGACTGNVKITYTRAFPDEDDSSDTTHVISNPGVATAPVLSSSGPCRTFGVAQGGTLSSGYIGGLGQRYGARSTILAFAQGEESFIDSNGNGLYDFGEPFVDLTEAFVDNNEDNVFGNGTPASDDSRDSSNRSCYGPAAPLASTASSGNCFQIGGDEEEPVDFNENGRFDAGNGIYNGTLCPLDISNRTDTCDNNADPCDEATEQYCTRDLVSINKEAVIIFSGSFASFALRDAATGERISAVNIAGLTPSPGQFRASSSVTNNNGATVGTTTNFSIGHADGEVRPGIGDTVNLISGSGSVVVDFADTFNQQLPAGTSVSVTTATGGCLITNTPGGSVLSNNSAGVNNVFMTLARDTTSTTASGAVTVTLTTPNGAVSTFSFTCTQS
jgi:protocatechuate 3,4-dioxygenase beta subunit/5-hydroxyisourate hydrolase-like protein (transthyretin family)